MLKSASLSIRGQVEKSGQVPKIMLDISRQSCTGSSGLSSGIREAEFISRALLKLSLSLARRRVWYLFQ